jgi:CHAD domain-containing protein
MAYQLERSETAADGLRRIAAEEARTAAAALRGATAANRDEAIHEARKSVKKLRALLRFVRPEIGPVYDAESARLRRVGGGLSRLRDAGAVIETLDGLTERFQQDLGRTSLASIRRALAARKREAERRAGAGQVLNRMATALAALEKRVGRWPLPGDGFKPLVQGIERTYRRSRKAFERARRNPDAARLHEWRKRVKDHWYQMRLLGPFFEGAGEHEKDLRNLQNLLGDDHNLTLLAEALSSKPLPGTPAAAELCRGLIERYQKELRENALALGPRIYSEKPRKFTSRMEALWDVWQAAAPSPAQLEHPGGLPTQVLGKLRQLDGQ